MTIDEEEESELELEDEVDEIGKLSVLRYADGEPLRVGPKEKDRDKHRWELDPASADDYVDRMHEHPDEAEPLRHMRHEHKERH